MKTKYIDKEIAILERMEQLEAISQQGLDKLNEFRHLRDLAKGQKLPIPDVVGQSEQLVCSRCNENEKQEANDPYCVECKIEIEGQAN